MCVYRPSFVEHLALVAPSTPLAQIAAKDGDMKVRREMRTTSELSRVLTHNGKSNSIFVVVLFYYYYFPCYVQNLCPLEP